MDTVLLRDAVEAILAMMEWSRNVSDQYLDGNPEDRKQLVQDTKHAKETIRRLNAAIAEAK